DHWPNAFSVLLAGGGVRGGQVIGASDREGAFPKDRPVTPEELVHSIYVLLGIDPTKFLPSTSGRDIQIVRNGKFIPQLTRGGREGERWACLPRPSCCSCWPPLRGQRRASTPFPPPPCSAASRRGSSSSAPDWEGPS